MNKTHLYTVYQGERLATAFVTVPGIETVDPILEPIKGLTPLIGPIACTAAFNEDRGSLQLHFVNYPRSNFGAHDQETTERAAAAVAYCTGGLFTVPEPHKITHLSNGIVTMGRRTGYDGKEIPSDVLREEIANKARGVIIARDVELVSISYNSVHREPALELDYRLKKDLSFLAQLAYDYHQERFSLQLPRLRRVFMIETEHCLDPDTELPSLSRSKMNLVPFVYRDKIFPRPVESSTPEE